MEKNKRDYQIRLENDQPSQESTEENIFINPDRNADWIKRANQDEMDAEDSADEETDAV